MTREEIIAALIEAAQSADSPLQLSSQAVDEALRQGAETVFDDWESALAAALIEAASGLPKKRRKPQVADVERRITEAFEHPLYVETMEGKFFSMHGPDLAITDGPRDLDEGGHVSAVSAIHYIGDSDAVYLFSDKGRFFGVDGRMVPLWDRRDQRRSIRDVLFLEGDEGIRAVVPRRQMATGRVIHVTAQGKGKATDASEFGPGLDRSGREAFLIKEGDDLVAAMAGPTQNTVFCASALGQGIHFEADELRSMGRKAVGVNVMKLDGEEDAIVAAFLGRHVRQIAVITEEGMGKRLDFSEFRTQGRAGQGMQLARLNPGDRIAGVAPCNPAEDLALTTSSGRVWRLPAAELMFMGRPAKGNSIVNLDPGERIIHLAALPCGG